MTDITTEVAESTFSIHDVIRIEDSRTTLTEIGPVIHATHNDYSLPEVTRDIDDLSDDHSEKESQDLVYESKHEERTHRWGILRRECGDCIRKYQGRERNAHEDP